MTNYAIAIPAKPQGNLDDIAAHMSDSFWGDIAREGASGSDRGLIQSAVSVVETMLQDLLLSDYGATDLTLRATIQPGGALCSRAALLDYLEGHGFMNKKEAHAAHSLFTCADRYFRWDGDGVLADEQWAMLEPLLKLKTASVAELDVAERKEVFFWAVWELSLTLIDLISNREKGLA